MVADAGSIISESVRFFQWDASLGSAFICVKDPADKIAKRLFPGIFHKALTTKILKMNLPAVSAAERFIDALKGVKNARELFRTREIVRYCSILSKKELLSKGGLKDSERKKIMDMLGNVKVLRIDDDIHRKYFSFIR